MTERSVLRVRQRPHVHPERKDEEVWEVLRGGKVVATIYGSREGINIVSDLAPRNRAFTMEGARADAKLGDPAAGRRRGLPLVRRHPDGVPAW